MKKSFTIHILHRPTNTLLCADGVFRGFVSCCGSKDDTLMYRSVGHALRRLNTRKPGKRIREDMLKDCALDVVWTAPGGFKAYRLDRFGKEVDDGPHGGNSSEYAVA
jgi:hypothetical protein